MGITIYVLHTPNSLDSLVRRTQTSSSMQMPLVFCRSFWGNFLLQRLTGIRHEKAISDGSILSGNHLIGLYIPYIPYAARVFLQGLRSGIHFAESLISLPMSSQIRTLVTCICRASDLAGSQTIECQFHQVGDICECRNVFTPHELVASEVVYTTEFTYRPALFSSL